MIICLSAPPTIMFAHFKTTQLIDKIYGRDLLAADPPQWNSNTRQDPPTPEFFVIEPIPTFKKNNFVLLFMLYDGVKEEDHSLIYVIN